MAALAGGALGLSSTLLIDRTRSRRDRREQWLSRRLEVYVDYLAELSRAYETLWALARREHDAVGQDLDAAARLVLRSGAVFQIRQRLKILASRPVITSGDVVFGNLMEMRAVVGAGHRAESPEFRYANQTYRSSMDDLREDIRSELDLPPDPSGWRARMSRQTQPQNPAS